MMVYFSGSSKHNKTGLQPVSRAVEQRRMLKALDLPFHGIIILLTNPQSKFWCEPHFTPMLDQSTHAIDWMSYSNSIFEINSRY